MRLLLCASSPTFTALEWVAGDWAREWWLMLFLPFVGNVASRHFTRMLVVHTPADASPARTVARLYTLVGVASGGMGDPTSFLLAAMSSCEALRLNHRDLSLVRHRLGYRLRCVCARAVHVPV